MQDLLKSDHRWLLLCEASGGRLLIELVIEQVIGVPVDQFKSGHLDSRGDGTASTKAQD